MRFCLLVSLFVMSVACGDDGNEPPGGGSGMADAPNNTQVDAPDNPTPDAPPNPGAKQLGSTCTPSGSNPQGDCPDGFQCLQLQGGSAPWCSKVCDAQQDTCDQGYTGPGLARCLWLITPAGSTEQIPMCGVFCDMDNGSCSDTQCNGTCPGELMCTASINATTKACQ